MVNLPTQILSKLREWQIRPAQQLHALLQQGQNAVDLSDCGAGKTFVACSVVKSLDPIQTLVVCPKISVTTWQRTLALFDTSASVIGYEKLRTGRTPFGQWQNRTPAPTIFKCEHCQCIVDAKSPRCYAIPSGVHCVAPKKGRKKRGQFVYAPQTAFVIFDEVHKCSGLNSDNAELLIAARRQGKKMLGLSATLATSPLQMRAIGYALDLFPNPDAAFYGWTRRHGCGKIPALPGWRWLAGAERQKEIMARISDDILPAKGVRVRTEDIPDFPTRQIIPTLYDIDNPTEIDAAYSEMEDAIRLSEHLHPLTAILRARQRAEFSKISLFVELAQDEMAKGNSVAVFCCFRATLDELRKRLRCDCFVDGSPEGVARRDEAINAFQANAEKLILLNNAAGGVSISLHDLTGEHPRVGLVSPGFSATEFLQVCGRLHRAGGKSKCVYRIVLAANTVEEAVYKALKRKESNLDALNDFDLTPSAL